MARREVLYRGSARLTPTDGPEVGPQPIEFWQSGSTAVAFDRGTNALLGTLHDVVRSLDDSGRLTLTGSDGVWQALDDVHQGGAWVGVEVRFADGSWRNATVAWSNYGVTVSAAGKAQRVIVGARTETYGAQAWILSGDTRIEIGFGTGCRTCGGG